MGRKRSSQASLPPYMYLQRNTFYFRSPLPPRAWRSLGNELQAALTQYHALITGNVIAPSSIKHRESNAIVEAPNAAWTFEQAVAWYFREFVPKKRIRTQQDNGREIVRPLAVFAQMLVRDISAKQLRAYLHERGKTSEIRANRELALVSHMFTKLIEFEVVPSPNPCFSVKRFAESARSRYVTDEEYAAVYREAAAPLQDVLDLALYLGQRPADTLAIELRDVTERGISIEQRKTRAKVLIQLTPELSEIALRISARSRQTAVRQWVVDTSGKALTPFQLRRMFDEARARAGVSFQIRDLRAKNATDTNDIFLAQQRLAHTTVATTQRYIRNRAGTTVAPLSRIKKG